MLDVLLLSLTALFFFFLVCCVPFFFLLCSLIFCKQLKFGVDESYKLSVPATGNPMYAQIEVSKLLTADVFACDCTKENEILVYRKPKDLNTWCISIASGVLGILHCGHQLAIHLLF